MKKMMFILMIMTAFLASAAFADAPADITNPSFENATGGVCDSWTLWAGGGATDSIYHEGDAANANTGDDYFEVGNGGAGWSGIHTEAGQEVAVTPGTDAEMVLFAKTADGSTVTGSVLIKFEFYATQGEGWQEGTTPFGELPCDTGSEYGQYSLVYTVPAGMNYARATVVSTGTSVHVDDVWVGNAGEFAGGSTPTGPVPANGSIQSVKNAPAYGYAPVTSLSWINPQPLVETDNLGVEVKFELEASGVYDPNWGAGNAIPVTTSTASGSDMETVLLSAMTPAVGALADDSLWSWQVTITDPNGPGADVVTEGNVWLFSTGDALPIIETVVDQYMWLDQVDGDGDSTIRTFTVTTTYTDDGKSAIVDANFTTGDWLWANGDAGVIEVSDDHTPDADDALHGLTLGCKSGTVVAVYKTVALGDDPLRPTEETQLPGWWNIGLEVTDDTDRTTSGGTGYNRIDLTCGEAAAAGGDEAFDAKYDVNSDCINDVVDFAALAEKWLDQSPKFE